MIVPEEPASDAAAEGVSEGHTAFDSSVSALYDEAKRTIAQWCRDADDSARRIIANAETTRRLAHAEAQRVREAARLEAGRILADAEARAGEIRAGIHLTGAERAHDIEVLQGRVEKLGASVDYLLDSLEGVMNAIASFSPGRPVGPVTRELGAGPAVDNEEPADPS